MENIDARKSPKEASRRMRGWVIALGIVAAFFAVGFVCCTFIW